MTEGAFPADPGALPAAGRADPAGADRRWRLRHLPWPLAVCGLLTVLAAVVGAIVGGSAGALGAAAGVALATVGYLLSTVAIAWADSVAPRLVLTVGLAVYVLKITVIAGVLTVAAAVGWAGLIPMAWGVVAGVLGWTTTLPVILTILGSSGDKSRRRA